MMQEIVNERSCIKKEAASVTLDILISKESASEPKIMHNKFVHTNGSLTHP